VTAAWIGEKRKGDEREEERIKEMIFRDKTTARPEKVNGTSSMEGRDELGVFQCSTEQCREHAGYLGHEQD